MHAGIVVAVKVRHPGVSQAIQRDFALMLRMARIASLVPFIRELRLEDTLAQFAAPLREQVDPQRLRILSLPAWPVSEIAPAP